MARGVNSLKDKILHRRSVRRWQKFGSLSKTLDLAALRVLRSRARQLQMELNKTLHIADGRLTLPLIGSNSFKKPLYSDWAYRPELWRGPLAVSGIAAAETKAALGGEVVVYHDCRISELTLRQVRNTRESDLAPFGLRMDVFQFDGSFLSLVVDLPESSVAGLLRNHLVRMACVIEMEKPLEIFARLNIQHGPNKEQIVRELPLDLDEVVVEFDLAYTKMNEKRVERMWVDLVFENPEMSQVVLRDVNFSRRPRAEL